MKTFLFKTSVVSNGTILKACDFGNVCDIIGDGGNRTIPIEGGLSAKYFCCKGDNCNSGTGRSTTTTNSRTGSSTGLTINVFVCKKATVWLALDQNQLIIKHIIE